MPDSQPPRPLGWRPDAPLSFRYSHLNTEGDTSSGRCFTEIVVAENGRLHLHETWAWESRHGTGTSLLEELD